MGNCYGSTERLEDPFKVRIIKDCKLSNMTTDNQIIVESGEICVVDTSSGKNNCISIPTKYSFRKIEADDTECYLGFLNESDFDDYIEQRIICRI